MASNERTPKTVKERRAQIQSSIIPLLNTPSAYTVWDPIKMDWRISRSTRILTVGEIEVNFMAGKYAKSDMHILKAVHALGFATKVHIFYLLQYWRRHDEKEAQKDNRRRLNIPNLGEKELWGRIMELCRYGVLIRNEFWSSDILKKTDDTPRSVFHVSASGTNMYKTILGDNTLSFDQRQAYMNEEDVFRYVLSDMLLTGFLSNKCISSVRFNVSVHAGRRNYPVMSELMVGLGESGDHTTRCRLLLEGVTFRTNTEVITYTSRYKNIQGRIRDLWNVVQFYNDECPVYLLLCAEDGYGIKALLNIIAEIHVDMFRHCLFTTGAVLEMNHILIHPERVKDCFLEYVPEGDGKLIGAVGYFFLEWE